MAVTPSTDNYQLGKGVVYFDRLNPSTGLFEGERDLGNAPEFSYNVAIEKLEHYSSRGGLKAKDKEVISQVTPSLKFSLDEVNVDNLSMLNLGSSATIPAVVQNAAVAEAITAHINMRSTLMFRGINYHTLPYDDSAADNVLAVAGEALTAAGGATAVVIAVTGTATTGTLTVVLTNTIAFIDGETVTGDVAAAFEVNSATGAIAGTLSNPVVLVQDQADTVTYVAGTDYEISGTLKDDEIGRIKILDGGTIVEGDVLHVTYGYASDAYEEITALTETSIQGKFRFVSDNPVGENFEIEYHSVSITPDGDASNIGDDWTTLAFTGEVLKDETNHPTQPYYVLRELD